MMLRRLVGRQAPCLAFRSSSIGEALVVSSAAASHSTPIRAAVQLFASAVTHGRAAAFNPVFVNQNRNFSSPPSSDSSTSQNVQKKGLANAVSKPNIHAVPKPHFFQNGRTGGRVGANVDRMRKAYSPQQLGTNRFRRNKKIKKIDLPTHYLEVNHKIQKAIMFYGPHIAHIPLHVSMKDLNLLCWSEYERRYK